MDRLKTEIEAQLGPPTVVVNAAGIFGPIAQIKDSDPQDWIETLMIDTVGPYLSRALYRRHVSRRLGAHYQPFIRGRYTRQAL